MSWIETNPESSPRTKADELAQLSVAVSPYKIEKAVKVSSVWYIAAETPTKSYVLKSGDSKGILAVVIMTKRHKGRKTWSYRVELELDGPTEAKAPYSILRMLSELGDDPRLDRAKEWRKDCRKYLDRPQPKVGDVIKLTKPGVFDTGTGTRFRKVYVYGYRGTYECLDNPEVGTVVINGDMLLDAVLEGKE